MHERHEGGVRGARFTPTCVGNARVAADEPVDVAVHPHVCGECAAVGKLNSTRFGSPPRVWGMPRAAAHGAGLRRFTPTCVGNANPTSTL